MQQSDAAIRERTFRTFDRLSGLKDGFWSTRILAKARESCSAEAALPLCAGSGRSHRSEGTGSPDRERILISYAPETGGGLVEW